MQPTPVRNQETYSFHPSILREYDVRGIMGETLSVTDAYFLGRAYAALVQQRNLNAARICVGYDGRISSPELEAALVEGIAQSGLDVVRVGLGPTPLLYFATRTLGADGGVMITGSHNPPNHNGFKFMLGKGSLFGSDIRAFGEIAARGAWAEGEGNITRQDLRDAYIQTLVQAFHGDRPLKVVWDAGNGAAGEMVERLCAQLPGTHTGLFTAIDGSFPNHHPDPAVMENLQDVIRTVREQKADLGLAFDGDGDRVGVVDDEGVVLWGDQLMVLFAAEVLQQEPGATIIADVKASQNLFDSIAEMGGTPLMWKTGHSLIKAKMAETGAPLAGEMSGHMFFADKYFGYDDGLYAAIRMLGIVSRAAQPLSVLRSRLKQSVSTPELRIACPDDRKFVVIQELQARLRREGTPFNDIDGLRVNTPDGWWLLRASNTQSAIVARCEGATVEARDRMVEVLKGLLADVGVAFTETDGH